MFTALDRCIKDGEIKKALEWIIAHAKSGAIDEHFTNEIKAICIQNLSKLSIINKEKKLHIIQDDAYRLEFAKISWNAVQLAFMMKNNDFSALDSTRSSDDEKRKKQVKEGDLLDKAFKLLLVILFLISIVIFSRTILLSQTALQERLFQASISFIGGFGSFFGYFRWRLTEMQ